MDNYEIREDVFYGFEDNIDNTTKIPYYFNPVYFTMQRL